MDFLQLVNKRQSDRKYDLTKPVEALKISACIEAARMAPSACNAQPWKFISVTNPDLRTEVGKAAAGMGMNSFCATAPLIVALVLEKPNFTSKIGSVLKDKEYTLMDIGIAATHFCLQATELGLGTCMVGWFDEKKVRKLLSIPSSKRIPLLITVGYPDSPLRSKARKKPSDIHTQNKY